MTIIGRESTALESIATAFKDFEEGLNPFSQETFKRIDLSENFLGIKHLFEVFKGLVAEMWAEFIKACMVERICGKNQGNQVFKEKKNGFGAKWLNGTSLIWSRRGETLYETDSDVMAAE